MSIPDVVVQEVDTACPNQEENRYFETGSIPSQLDLELKDTSRGKSPVTVQEWVDSLPLTPDCDSREECHPATSTNLNPNNDFDTDNMFTLGAEAGHECARKTSISSPVNVTITSCQESSEVDSHCSSVDSLLEARKPDPEEILLSLGFGGIASSSYLETGRVPKRFLSPSQLKGVDIEEFIRQQRDLIYTFESGFYGYRGLAECSLNEISSEIEEKCGPSHSNPSVIVAKILEKLREHEKETALMNSYSPDSKRRYSIDQKDIEKQSRKFSKVARNVLTKIRCTPGSVLSPDNRRWLDNQGNKSPEVARRLILGQQSFTFGHDGNLIESFDVHKSDRNEILNSDYECKRGNPEHRDVQELSSTSESATKREKEINDQHRLPHECTVDADSSSRSPVLPLIKLENDDDRLRGTNLSNEEKIETTCSSLTPASTTATTLDQMKDKLCSKTLEENGQESRVYSLDMVDDNLSLHDEVDESSEESDIEVDVNANTMTRNTSVSTAHDSYEIRDINSNDEFGCQVVQADCQYSMNVNEFSDSATESEFATYAHSSISKKNICEQYEEFIVLKSKIRHLGKLSNFISREQFLSLTTEQRTSMQSRLIREALEMYLSQLKEDDINIELKNCLSNEVRKVFDLVDSSSDSSKLAIIVRQMTLLLQQQNRLSAQIKELSVVGSTPSSCNKMCDHLLKRVQELELLVQQNAQELAHMKNQLLSKK